MRVIPVFGFGVLSAALDPATYWSRFHGDDVSKNQRGVKRCRRDCWMKREQSFGAPGRAARRAADELFDGVVE